ncbi:MAG: GGDEF domain-containing protein [Eubacteriales bacterium]|nr:GGDEF domain-containing protein [Eubacteriales bacterium]
MKRLKRVLILLCTLLVLPLSARAAEQARLVRVGYPDIDGYLTVEQDYATGYLADYLHAIARCTGWQYEYRQGTWSECLRWLAEGEIDLLSPCEYSAERAETLLYSDYICCRDYTAIYCLNGNEELYADDPESLRGRGVGLIESNYLNDVFEGYLAANGISVRRRYYRNGAELDAALESGEVDAIVNGNFVLNENYKLLEHLNSTNAYFVASKEESGLMEELNAALRVLHTRNPFLVEKLQDRYYGLQERQAVSFSREETAYIQSAPALRVLFDSDDLPSEWYENGEYHGLYPELIRMIFEACGLPYVAVEPSDKGSWERIRDGEADVLASAFDSDALQAAYNLDFTQQFYEETHSVLMRRGGTAVHTVAVPAGLEGLAECLSLQQPDWRQETYPDMDACVQSVREGRTDAALVNTLALQTNQYLSLYPELANVMPVALRVPVCLAVSRTLPATLLSVLEKGVCKLKNEEIQAAEINAIMNTTRRATLRELITRYPAPTLIAVGLLAVLLSATCALLLFNRGMGRKNRQLEEKNRELAAATLLASRLRRQSETDALTGLLNKATAQALCADFICAAGGAGRAALLVIDIDHFKDFNDRYGHQFGDMLLEEFGGLLRGFCRENDLVGRVGGDEFVILYCNVEDAKVVERRAAQICDACRSIDANEVGFTCSIGVALYPENGDTYEALFAAADQAMYVAKDHGRSCFSFASDQ